MTTIEDGLAAVSGTEASIIVTGARAEPVGTVTRAMVLKVLARKRK